MGLSVLGFVSSSVCLLACFINVSVQFFCFCRCFIDSLSLFDYKQQYAFLDLDNLFVNKEM